MSNRIVSKTGGYPDLPGDIRVERFSLRRTVRAITAYDADGAFIIAAELVKNYEEPAVLAGNVVFPEGWPWGKGTTISMVIVDDAKRYLAMRVLDRVLSELEDK